MSEIHIAVDRIGPEGPAAPKTNGLEGEADGVGSAGTAVLEGMVGDAVGEELRPRGGSEGEDAADQVGRGPAFTAQLPKVGGEGVGAKVPLV